jgi:hypothetical protein
MVRSKVFDVNRNASYEFKYVIDGTFVNEPDADSFNGICGMKTVF